MSAHTTSEASPAADGRQANGRFAKGNKFGPGNPFARKVAALRSALIDLVTEHDILEIAERLLLDAKNGDKAAVKLLFSYVLGKPAPVVDPDALDVQEMQGFQRGALPMEAFQNLQHALPVQLAVEMWRHSLPCLMETMGQHIADRLHEQDDDDSEEVTPPAAPEAPAAPQSTAPAAQTARPASGAARAPARPQPTAAPSPDGGDVDGFDEGDDEAPSTNGSNGMEALIPFLHWLGRQRGSSNGAAHN